MLSLNFFNVQNTFSSKLNFYQIAFISRDRKLYYVYERERERKSMCLVVPRKIMFLKITADKFAGNALEFQELLRREEFFFATEFHQAAV